MRHIATFITPATRPIARYYCRYLESMRADMLRLDELERERQQQEQQQRVMRIQREKHAHHVTSAAAGCC